MLHERWPPTGIARVLIATILIGGFLVLGQADLEAATSDGARSLVAQGETPYVPPEIDVGTPSWLRPFGVLADLPLWAQAAVVAAAIAAAVVVIPTAIRFMWRHFARGRFSNESER